MTDRRHTPISNAQLTAVRRALTERAFRARREEEVTIFNFRFRPDMLPGWKLARARQVQTGQDVRLVQVNASSESPERIARIEVLEARDFEAARTLFMETLARFQRDPATIIRSPPRIGDAEASLGGHAFVFQRGNLVVTVTGIGPVAMPVEDLARRIEQSISERPGPARPSGDAAIESDAVGAARPGREPPPMIKVFTRRTRGSVETEAFAIAEDGSVSRLARPPSGGAEG